MLQVNNILELLLKYHFHTFMTSIEIYKLNQTSLILFMKHYLMKLKSPFEITRFPLFQMKIEISFVSSINKEHDLFKYFLLNYGKRRV